MELRWMEPEMGGSGASASSPIKLVCYFFDVVGIAAVISLSSHRGGGDEEEFLGKAGGSKNWRPGAYPPPRGPLDPSLGLDASTRPSGLSPTFWR
jgi:hypothetical protein